MTRARRDRPTVGSPHGVVIREEFDRVAETGGYDVLPMAFTDGRRITCAAMAGGARMVNGYPEHLDLEFYDPRGIVKGGMVKRVRYVSEFEISRRLDPFGSPLALAAERDRLEQELGPRRKRDPNDERVMLLHWIERLIMPADADERAMNVTRFGAEIAAVRLARGDAPPAKPKSRSGARKRR